MVDQGRSELHVALTIILCGKLFYLVDYEVEIHKLSLNSFSEPVYLIAKLLTFVLIQVRKGSW